MLTVSYCGHDSHHAAPCNIEHKNGSPDWLLLLVKSDAWFICDSQKIPVLPGMAILYAPGMPVHYGRDQAGYCDDWLHFSAADPETCRFLSSLSIPLGVPLYPEDFSRLCACMSLLCRSFRSAGEYHAEIMDQLLKTLIMTLSQETAHRSLPEPAFPTKKAARSEQAASFYIRFSHLRARIYNDPAFPWDLEALAAELNISLSHFQHLYKQYFDISCRSDIIFARIELAQMYLRQSDMTVHHIASLCGYDSELHFMRQFRQRTGITPTQYRRHTFVPK